MFQEDIFDKGVSDVFGFGPYRSVIVRFRTSSILIFRHLLKEFLNTLDAALWHFGPFVRCQQKGMILTGPLGTAFLDELTLLWRPAAHVVCGPHIKWTRWLFGASLSGSRSGALAANPYRSCRLIGWGATRDQCNAVNPFDSRSSKIRGLLRRGGVTPSPES